MCYTYKYSKSTKTGIKGNDLQLMEALLAEGHIEHKFAVRLQTVINRAKDFSTNDIALFLGININTVSSHVQRYNNGGIEALLCDKTRKPRNSAMSFVERSFALLITVCSLTANLCSM